jgi:peptidoglycan/xylan/chitin deacetylase (PgdA/CDA1 family)
LSGTFIISLDCEGKWGMADHLEPYHQRLLTDRALANVYDCLVELFGRYDMAATFAFVMAFLLDPEERRQFPALLDKKEAGNDGWLRHYWADIDAGGSEGWFQPHALEAVNADGRHEIACHSFCHRPMDDTSLSAEGARTELAAAAHVAKLKQVDLKTFIFPRNAVGNLPLLAEAGYIGYRERLARPDRRLGRIARLAEEFNLWPAVQMPREGHRGLVPIPPGYFFNWRFGARRYIPPAITLARWKSLLNRSAQTNGVAHLWLHPHNLITSPDTAETLEAVLAHAARLRDGGRIEVLTQEAFSRTALSAAGPGGPALLPQHA